MQQSFAAEGLRRVLFGAGQAAQVGEEVKLMAAEKALLVVDPNLKALGLDQRVGEYLAQAGVQFTTYSDITREPEPDEADAAAALGKDFGAQAVVGLGGGSALDLAKAAAALITNGGKTTDYIGLNKTHVPALPSVMLPTTSGTGSECTFTAVFTRRADQFKGGINGRHLFPHTAILDPELTLSCPAYITAITGMDALTHAMESYTSLKAHAISRMHALEAIRLIGENLRAAVANGQNLAARSNMLLGSFLAGQALAQAGVGAVHAMAYPLGSMYDIPHGEANAVLLPFVLEHNLMACPELFAEMGYALCELEDDLTTRQAAEACVEEVFLLAEEIGIPQSVSELGVPVSAIDSMADKAMGVAVPIANNPRKVAKEDLVTLYKEAFQ